MSYQVLYRRFRPAVFSEIVGQEHITSILKNQIITGKISHAYLFSGPKGTGKTSAAKVFARAVNCMNPQGGEPCGECDYCKGVLSRNIPDIIEIDAASNRGIDEIRQLKETVGYLPATGNYRVYIIDEVHMLTAEAFNALLKTLEEPPAHVIFIFATTEPHKVLPTILSRCQRFDFVRIPNEVIAERVKYVLCKIGAAYDESAVALIASSSDGALRDALSLTDKALTLNAQIVEERSVMRALGLANEESVTQIAQAVMDGDISSALETLDAALAAGGDVAHMITQLIEYFRNLMIYTNTKNPERIIAKGSAYLDSLKKSSLDATPQGLIASIHTLSRLKSDSRYMPQPRYLLESALLYLCGQKEIVDYLTLNARVERLEKKAAQFASAPPEKIPPPRPDYDEPFVAAPMRQRREEKAELTALPVTQKEVLAQFQKELKFAGEYIHNKDRDIILADVFSNLKPAAFSEGRLYVYPVSTAVHMMDVFASKGGKAKLEDILSERRKERVAIEICEKQPAKQKDVIDQMREVLGDITEIEDDEGGLHG